VGCKTHRPIGQPLKGHLTHVESVAFSPDNSFLASGSQDETVILWDVSDVSRPRIIGRPLKGQAMVDTLAFSPDGRVLAVGNWDGAVTLWDVNNPSAPVRIGSLGSESQTRAMSVAFSPDGKMLAAVEGDGITLWDVSNVSRIRAIGEPLKGHATGVDVIAFSPDGKSLASGGTDKTVINGYNKRIGTARLQLANGIGNLVGCTMDRSGHLYPSRLTQFANGVSDHDVVCYPCYIPQH
jgi:WD40 repeat protein